MRRRQRRMLALAGIACAVLGGMIGHSYYADQAKIRGGIFGGEIEIIQDDLARMQDEFSALVRTYREGGMTDAELAAAAEEHFDSMRGLIVRYDGLDPPGAFESSVELFRLSAQSQLDGDMQIASWIRTGDESYGVRADSLYQEAFQYELAALADFKAAQSGAAP